MQTDHAQTVTQLLGKAERVGVIGSPSSTSELTLEVLGSASAKRLVGDLALFEYRQDGIANYALGQITEIELHNVWHEDPTMRSLIRQKGRVDPVSERQDTHQGKMTVSAVFADSSKGYVPSSLGTVPPTGTPISLADDEMLDTLLRPYRKQLFYLGHVYGSKPLLPLWFKHFDSGTTGAGEAYHLGIFGKTGSGKSVLAKMIVLAYAQHKDMGLLIFDPQGEFSLGLRSNDDNPPMGKILSPILLKSLGRSYQLFELGNIQLDRWELLGQLLVEFRFFFDLGVKTAEYQEDIADRLLDHFRQSKHTLVGLTSPEAFTEALDFIDQNIQRVYASAGGVDRIRGFINEVRAAQQNSQPHSIKERWDKTVRFFASDTNKKTPGQIIGLALQDKNQGRPLVVLDLSRRPADIGQGVWDDKIRPLIIDRFLWELSFRAEAAYKDEKSLNTLVVLDEAHRLASNERQKNERAEKIKVNLRDAVRTTRKYGLGWMFLSQTLSSLDSEIVQQLRTYFFGFGLSMGTEFQKLRELVGDKESISLYQRFRDPQSAFDSNSREYSFMTIGPVSPLSFSGTPLFLSAFNTSEEFITTNRFKIQEKLF